MEKEQPLILGGGGGGGLPPSSSLNVYALPSAGPATSLSSSQDMGISHDISRMLDCPSRNVGHRRAHSENLSLPDDNNFYSDLGVVGYGDGPSLSDDIEEAFLSMYIDIDKSASSSAVSGWDLSGSGSSMAAEASTRPRTHAENVIAAQNMHMRARHQHSQSMDDFTSIKSEALSSGIEEMPLRDAKKAMSSEKLADLALVDPKRAKRVWANRQSAARSKERKMRYIADLERKAQTLQTEASMFSTQLAILHRDNTGLTAENSELKLRLQSMEHQVHLQDALNDALREEVQQLKIATGQGIPNGGQMMNFGQSSFGGVNQQYYHHNHAMQSRLAAHQIQQIQMHPQHQQQLHHQQQQQQQHQLQQYTQHSSPDPRLRGMTSSQTQRENASDACPPQD